MLRDPGAEPMTRADKVKTGVIVFIMVVLIVLYLTGGRL